MIFKESINREKFKVYIEELRARYFFDDICLYFDNMAVHRSKDIRDRLDELSIPYIFNPPYSPDFNPIETIFSFSKRKLKVSRLQAIVNNKDLDIK